MTLPKVENDENENRVEHTNRGYEITDGQFYVDDVTYLFKEGKCVCDINGQPRTYRETKHFQNFEDYYLYLDKDIYTQACYFGWNPSDDITKKYSIEEQKLNRVSLRSDTIEEQIWNSDETIKELISKNNQRQNQLKRNLERLLKCNTSSDIKKCMPTIQKYWGQDFRIIISLFFERKSNAEELLYESVRQNYVHELLIYDILAYCKKPVQFAEAVELSGYSKNTIRKYKKGILFTAQAFQDFENHVVDRKAYYDGGFYVIETKIYSDTGRNHYRLKVFEDFREFTNALNNDLRGVDLSNCVLKETDFTKYKIDNKTILPLIENGVIDKQVNKGFSGTRYFVNQEWKDTYGTVHNSQKKYFDHFAEYIHFIGDKLDGSDFSNMPSDIFERIKETGIDLNGIVAPVIFNEPWDTTEFVETAQSEKETQLLLQTVHHRQETVLSSELDGMSCRNPILYLSDLHLDHIINNAKCKTMGDVQAVLNKIGSELEFSYRQYYHRNALIVINGDIAHSQLLFSLFVNMNFSFLRKSFIVLGNHELWPYPGMEVNEIVDKYRKASSVPIVQNEIILFLDAPINEACFSEGVGYRVKRISCANVLSMSTEELSEQMSTARIIMLAGIGFSGCNANFNADSGIYRAVLTRAQEMEESRKFGLLYERFLSASKTLKDHVRLVVTHMPIECWQENPIHEEGVFYISGHTHHNYYYDDGKLHIYADNQNGYHGCHPKFKCIYVNDEYDPFASYTDGVYEINKQAYKHFNQAKKIQMEMNREYKKIYMLKKNGYYCFISESASGGLCILNGGSRRTIPNRDITYYYKKMDQIISRISEPLNQYTAFQKRVSNAVKKFGGSGTIHGCIVDIDFYNHIYVNPIDNTIRGYYATDMINKKVYSSIPALLKKQRPEMFEHYRKLLESDSGQMLCLTQNKNKHSAATQLEMEYFGTDIYKASREISKMQKLYKKILNFWSDGLVNKGILLE